MAEFDFQKLGSDRFSQNIKRAVTNPVGNLTTGDITKGEVVVVKIGDPGTAADSGSSTVKGRRVGAIPIAVELDNLCEYFWSIDSTTLSVSLNVGRIGTITFWVF